MRCRDAETYGEMGLGKIGHLLSCNRDGTFCQGYDPNITPERKQTSCKAVPPARFDTDTWRKRVRSSPTLVVAAKRDG